MLPPFRSKRVSNQRAKISNVKSPLAQHAFLNRLHCVINSCKVLIRYQRGDLLKSRASFQLILWELDS